MTLPLENLDDKNFEDLVKEAVSRIPVYAPQWTDHNKTDPGITLIELLAWLTEMQIYRLNKINEECYKNFLSLVGVQNGQDMDISRGIREARKGLQDISRAVTTSDYESLALETNRSAKGSRPGVARSKAIFRYHPKMKNEVPNAVTVVVLPEEKNLIPKAGDSEELSQDQLDFLRDVYVQLDKYRLLTTELFVCLPTIVEISINVTVFKRPRYEDESVKKRVEERLREFIDSTKGGPNGDGWPFGRPVYISEIFQVIDELEGVDYVEGRVDDGRKPLESSGMSEIDENGNIRIPPHGLIRDRKIVVQMKSEKETQM